MILTGRITQSLDHLEVAVSLNPNYSKAYSYKAWVLCIIGRFSEALELCHLAISISDRVPDTYYIRARAYHGLHMYRKAIADIDSFLSLEGTPKTFSTIQAKKVKKAVSKCENVEF